MSEFSRIGWTDHTFSPWHGCVRVSPGCEHCYAEAFSKRMGRPIWGATADRMFVSSETWRKVLKWDRESLRENVVRSVFCGSMCDFAEINPRVPGLDDAREWLFALVEHTKNLRWLLLTKRPENVLKVVPRPWHYGFPDHVWVGTTFEDQKRLVERWEHLQKIPAHLFASCEPQIEDLDLSDCLDRGYESNGPAGWVSLPSLEWVIGGGESGGGAREYHLAWPESLIVQCRAARVPFYHKQLGLRPMLGGQRFPKMDAQGENWEEWPEHIRVREFPWTPAPPSTSRAARRSRHRKLPVVAT